MGTKLPPCPPTPTHTHMYGDTFLTHPAQNNWFCFSDPGSVPNGVAVDYISKLIYITDRGEDTIDVWSYDLRSHTTIVRNSEGLGEIVLDFEGG